MSAVTDMVQDCAPALGLEVQYRKEPDERPDLTTHVNLGVCACQGCGALTSGEAGSAGPVEALVSDYTALLSGSSWNGQNVTGRPVFVTFSFETTPQSYLSASGYGKEAIDSFQPLTEAQKDLARYALTQWADASGLVVLETPAGQGDIRFAKLNFSLGPYHPSALAYAAYPSFSADFGFAGDVFLNTQAANPDAYVFLHEIGHALGLKHSFAGPTSLDPLLEPETVMSYQRRDTLGAIDVDAIVHLYGGGETDGSHVASWSWDPVRHVLTQAGRDGDDLIRGVGVRDVIDGRSGADLIHGGDGSDDLHGGDGADRVHGDAANDHLTGGSGDDQLFGGGGRDLIGGQEGDDFIDGGPGADTLFGDGGADWIVGGVEEDRVSGGEGDDLVGGQEGNDWIEGGAGRDRLYGDTGADLIGGQAGDDVIDGGDGRDDLYGDGGADWMVGGGDEDRIFGGDGDDLIGGQGADDFIDGGSGRDQLYGDAGRDWMIGGTEGDGLDGGDGDDLIGGQDGDDLVSGGSGADVLYGDDGDDRIVGGAGDDRLDGGSGIDTAVFSGPRSAYVVGTSGDAVTVSGRDGVDLLFGIEVLAFEEDARSPLIHSIDEHGLLRAYASELADSWVL